MILQYDEHYLKLYFYNHLESDGNLKITDDNNDIQNIALYTRSSQAPNLININQITNSKTSQYDSLDNTSIVRGNVLDGNSYWWAALGGYFTKQDQESDLLKYTKLVDSSWETYT